jgi:hypothetical protein
VFLVPDGRLLEINFDALPSQADGKYLAENGPLFHVLNAERELLSTSLPQKGSHSLLAVGAPAFDRAPGSPRRRLRH